MPDHLNPLPKDLKAKVAGFLSTRGALRLSQTCQSMNTELSFSTLPFRLPSSNSDGHNTTGDTPRQGPQLPVFFSGGHTHSITFQCEWQDQGWGNKKAQLYIVGHTPNVFDRGHEFGGGRVIQISSIAEHYSTCLQLSFHPRGRDEEEYHLWFKVGGGGGHRLHVRTVILRAVIYENGQTENIEEEDENDIRPGF
jgi:hypothetical protein